MSRPNHIVPSTVTAALQRKGRAGFGFGRRFYLFALLGLIWVAPAFADAELVWGLGAWNALIFFLWLVDLLRLPRAPQFQARREWLRPLTLGVRNTYRWVVENATARTVHMQVVEDAPAELSPMPPAGELQVPRRGEAALELPCQPTRRGDVHFGKSYIRYESAWGLAQRWAVADLAQTVRVYPASGGVGQDSMYLLRTRRIEIEKRFRRKHGVGREFESLREFRDGDSFRDISWTATARRGKLVVREFQTERSQPIWLMVDCGRLMRMKVGELSKLDHAVSAALSVAQVALLSGDRVGLMAYGNAVQRSVGLGKGERQLRSLMEELAQVKEETAEANHLQAAGRFLAMQSRRSLVVWITDLADTAMTPEVIEGASVLLDRHLVLFAVIDNPALRKVAERAPEDPAQLYRSTAAHEVLLRREALIAGLRARGAHTLEIGVEGLSGAVVEQYFQIKERGLI